MDWFSSDAVATGILCMNGDSGLAIRCENTGCGRKMDDLAGPDGGPTLE